MVGNVKSSVLDFSRVFDKELINEQRLKPYKDSLKEVQDQVKVGNNVFSALNNLERMVGNLKKANTAFKAGILGTNSSAFSQKTTEVSTDDAGNGSDYVTAVATSNANTGSFNVTVNNIATAANTRTGLLPAAHTVTGNIVTQITITDHGNVQNINVALALGDDLPTVVGKLNAQLNAQNVQAVLVQAPGNQAAIMLSSTVTGDVSIAVDGNFTDEFADTGGNGFPAIVTADGVDANVTINGLAMVSPSNQLINVLPGITLNLKKANANGGLQQTITVVNDVNQAASKIGDWMKAANDYLEFSARQQEWGKDGYAETAYLAGNRVISTADSVIQTIFGMMPGYPQVPGQLNFNGLGSIGIALETLPATENAPEMRQIVIKDQSAFYTALNNNFNAVDKLFRVNANITANGANLGSSLTFISTDNINNNILPANVLGAPITINSTVDGGGDVTGVTFSTPSLNGGNPIAAAYNAGTITFPNTALSGLQLQFGINGTVNHVESFTLTINQGIAFRLAAGISTLSNNNSNGAVDLAVATARVQNENNALKEQKVQKALDEMQAKIKEQDAKLALMEFEADMTSEWMDAVLGMNK